MNKNVDDKMTVRRRNFEVLKDRSGNQWPVLMKKVGISASYENHLRTGRRPFSEKTAQKIETALGLRPGWFDLKEHLKAPGRASQISDEGLLPRVITAIDSALKASGKGDVKDTSRYGRLVEFVFEESSERGVPSPEWLTRLLKLILD